jgi:hypothetical protein
MTKIILLLLFIPSLGFAQQNARPINDLNVFVVQAAFAKTKPDLNELKTFQKLSSSASFLFPNIEDEMKAYQQDNYFAVEVAVELWEMSTNPNGFVMTVSKATRQLFFPKSDETIKYNLFNVRLKGLHHFKFVPLTDQELADKKAMRFFVKGRPVLLKVYGKVTEAGGKGKDRFVELSVEKVDINYMTNLGIIAKKFKTMALSEVINQKYSVGTFKTIDDTELYGIYKKYPYLNGEQWPKVIITMQDPPLSYGEYRVRNGPLQLPKETCKYRATVWYSPKEKKVFEDLVWWPDDYSLFNIPMDGLLTWSNSLFFDTQKYGLRPHRGHHAT